VQGIQHFLLDKAKFFPHLNNNIHGNKNNEKNEKERGVSSESTSDGKEEHLKKSMDKENGNPKDAHSPSASTSSSEHSTEKQQQQQQQTQDCSPPPPNVIVKPLGYTTNIASYMASSNILITKAGPGTIAEAASLGLPVLLTSFLPGQEEGNVDFVLENNFGDYVSDGDCKRVANTVLDWLDDDDKLEHMSREASRVGKPYAAREIVREIGKSAWRWKELNGVEEDEEGGGREKENIEVIEESLRSSIEKNEVTKEDRAEERVEIKSDTNEKSERIIKFV